ncbi:MAG: AAA family ATPase [Boseongicola sp.]|nr:AAA family ATPase [Boseongicola sp.]
MEGGRLTDGQRAAVRTLLLAEDAIVGVQGHAGSGKTAMLREAAALAGERRILGLAPSASAARVLAREAGVEAWTLQRFLVRHGDLSDPDRLARAREEFRGALLAVDEASMVDTARMEALLRTARTLGVARVALVGDTAQLRAVDAGQPFRLMQRAGMETAVMDEVLRQRDPALLEAVRRSREGAPGEATEILGERVREVPRGELGAEAGRRWLALGPEERTNTAIMAPTHAIRREVNAAVREGLAAEGALDGPSLVIDRLVDRRLTRAQAADIRSWEEGDTVVFHRDAYGCRQDDVCIVTGVEDGKVTLATPGGERRFRPSGNSAWWCRLHDTEEIEIRAGDRIRWTRNRKASHGRHGLVNGGEAEVLEIGGQRVRFRDADGSGFSLSRQDVQLRHLDHAYCTTVHAAQGATARSAIAVLDSAGAVDQALFHVELSRASEEFLLLTDDREGLVEALEARPGQDGGALEALGIDPERPPAVDPETFAALVADWRDLERRAEETGRDPFGLPGREEVMARAAALSAIEDLPPDMQRTLGTMLEGHGRRTADERKARDLAARVRAHWRRWPELGWAASAAGRHPEDMPGHAAWWREGDALIEEARAMQEGRRRHDRHDRPDREAAAWAAGLREGVAAIGRVRTLDDSGRFRRGCRALRDRARRDSVPEIHCAGWAATARIGERLEGAEGLDEGASRAVAEWKEACGRQEALAGAVRELSQRAGRWQARREAEDQPGLHDPADPARRALREEGERIVADAGAMLADGSPHAPHLDAMTDEAETVRRSLPATAAALGRDRRDAFAWLAGKVNQEARGTRVPPFHAPRFSELTRLAGEIARDPGTSDTDGKIARKWLDHGAESEALVREIRDWPRRADDLMKRYPGTDAPPEALAGWRAAAERELADHGRLTDGKGPHAAHLAAMPQARERLEETGEWLWRYVGRSAEEELRGREAEAWRQADAAGGIAFDAPAWGVLMEQVREIESKGDLPDAVRGEAGRLKGLDERWKRGRADVADVMDRAETSMRAHERLAPGHAGAWIEEAGETARRGHELADGMTARELAAHLVADGRKPDAFDRAMEGIGGVVAREVAERDRRQLADDVLVLACAVSERVDAESPVHRDTLPGDIRAVLEASAQAGNVPEAEVREVAAGIARERAETDMRIEVACRLNPADMFAARARFGADPEFSRQQHREAYAAGVADGMRRLDREAPRPTRIETRVARAVVATRGTEGEGLASAMAEALGCGTTATADGILKERAAVLAELQADWPEGEGTIGMMVREEAVLRRVSASFTGAEVREMCEGKGPVMDRLAGDAARTRVRHVMRKLQLATPSSDPAPWRARQKTLVRELGLERDRGAERYLGIEIEPF